MFIQLTCKPESVEKPNNASLGFSMVSVARKGERRI